MLWWHRNTIVNNDQPICLNLYLYETIIIKVCNRNWLYVAYVSTKCLFTTHKKVLCICGLQVRWWAWFPVARALNAGCVDILWRHLLRISSSLALVRSGRSLGTHSVSYFAFTLLYLFVHFYCTCLLGLIACSNYLLSTGHLWLIVCIVLYVCLCCCLCRCW